MSPQARETKIKLKWDCIKLKAFVQLRRLSPKQKGNLLTCADNISDKGLISKLCEKYIQLNIKKTQLKNGKRT